MLFALHLQENSNISIWIAPDDQRLIPRVRIVADKSTVIELTASVYWQAVKDVGWHTTGQCGFDIGAVAVPGYSADSDIDIRDYETNFLLYRRSKSLNNIAARLVYLDYKITQNDPLKETLISQFQISHTNLRNIDNNALRCMFGNTDIKSSFAYGELEYEKFIDVLDGDRFIRAVLICDPFIELATRILWLRSRAELALNPAQAWRIEHIAAPCAFATDLDFGNPVLLKRAFSGIDEESADFLSNPITRCLGYNPKHGKLGPTHWHAAVQNISRFEVVGHAEYYDSFAATLFDRLGIERPLPERRAEPKRVLELADLLRRMKEVDPLIEMDLELNERVLSVIRKHWSPGA
ncbi:conserved hypothetical protein [Methylobacterium nodulans ORS 2060]|uniref:Uncharacterized protein n=2 Tax=Methylobacterium nodulans TaxID=114616 RepID=B8IDE9_METNO|nr:conserved hypothetical protein [Methylobacterium nodulans ORS 2060]